MVKPTKSKQRDVPAFAGYNVDLTSNSVRNCRDDPPVDFLGCMRVGTDSQKQRRNWRWWQTGKAQLFRSTLPHGAGGTARPFDSRRRFDRQVEIEWQLHSSD